MFAPHVHVCLFLRHVYRTQINQLLGLLAALKEMSGAMKDEVAALKGSMQ